MTTPWAVSAYSRRHLTIKRLEMALKRCCPKIGLLRHSDHGWTLCDRVGIEVTV